MLFFIAVISLPIAFGVGLITGRSQGLANDASNARSIGFIDRFEGDIAVIDFEGGGTGKLPRRVFAKNVAEGHYLVFNVRADARLTRERRAIVEGIRKKLDASPGKAE